MRFPAAKPFLVCSRRARAAASERTPPPRTFTSRSSGMARSNASDGDRRLGWDAGRALSRARHVDRHGAPARSAPACAMSTVTFAGVLRPPSSSLLRALARRSDERLPGQRAEAARAAVGGRSAWSAALLAGRPVPAACRRRGAFVKVKGLRAGGLGRRRAFSRRPLPASSIAALGAPENHIRKIVVIVAFFRRQIQIVEVRNTDTGEGLRRGRCRPRPAAPDPAARP